MKDMRKYERFALALGGKMERAAAGNPEALNVVTSDVSAGGAFFHTGEPITEGSQVNFSLVITSKRLIELTGAKGLLKIMGTVVRSNAQEMAVSFCDKYEFSSIS